MRDLSIQTALKNHGSPREYFNNDISVIKTTDRRRNSCPFSSSTSIELGLKDNSERMTNIMLKV